MLLNTARGPKVWRLRPTKTTDSYGDEVESWDEPQRTRLLGADAQPVSEDEQDGVVRRLLTDVRRLFVRGAVDLTADDRVEIEGEGVWRVDGEPVVRRPLSAREITTAQIVRFVDRGGA